ncbi:MAG: diguanylate cyclase [Alteromonadaceae bacterium]|nr:diguanylate cyclase [Alteromonadaceae bacterium]
MPNFIHVIVVMILSLTLYTYEAQASNVVHKHAGQKEEYVVQILQKSINLSANKKHTLSEYPEVLTKERIINETELGNINVFWAATNRELEERFIAIRIPLYKGLFGYRLLIIKKEKQSNLSDVRQLSDLRFFKAGQGTFWEDTQILQSAQLPVITSTKYINLFHMLDGDRFDYFPRGIHEPWREIESWKQFSFMVEENLMLQYQMPVYFFVSRDNPELSDSIRNGLWSLIKSGEFDELFKQNPLVANALKLAKPNNRRIIKITNPNLSSSTPLDDERLWYTPN